MTERTPQESGGTTLPAVPKRKRGRPVITPEERARKEERAFTERILEQVLTAQKETSRAQTELSIAIQGWMKLFQVNAGTSIPSSWTNTDTTEYVREQAGERGLEGQPIHLSEAEQLAWLEKEMERD